MSGGKTELLGFLYAIWRGHPSLVILAFVFVPLIYFLVRPRAVFRSAWIILSLVSALSLLAAYSNLFWIRKGPIFQENDLLDLNNSIVKDDLLGRGLFGRKDTIILVVKGSLDDPETLRQVVEATEAVKKLPWVISEEVKSLATIPALTPNKTGFVDTAPILAKVPQDKSQMASLLEMIKDHPLIYGLLVGKKLDFALVVGALKDGYDQQALYREVEEILKVHPNWGATGYPYIRETTDVTVTREIFQRSLTLGVLGLAVILVIALESVGGLLIIPIILLGILWTRGTIGITDQLGLHSSENVYTLMVYVTHLVAATSPYYLIQSYKRTLKEYPGLGSRDALIQTLEDHRLAVSLVDLVPIIGFGTLLTFQINTLREFGEYMALGIGYILLLTFTLLPLLLMRTPRSFFEGKGFVGRLSGPVHARLERVSANLVRGILRKSDAFLACLTLSGATFLISLGIWVGLKINIGTRPLDYIPNGTSAKDTSLMLNRSSGFDRIYFLADSGAPRGVFGPEFLRQIQALNAWIGGKPETGYVESPVKAVKTIRRAYDGKYEVGESVEANAQLFFLDEMSPVSATAGQLDPSKRYLVFGIYTPLLDDSRSTASFIRDILDHAERIYPEIKLKAWGQAPRWVAIDDYIGPGKTKSIILAILVVFVSIAATLWLTGSAPTASAVQGALGTTPLIIATVITLTVIVTLGYRMDLATAPISAVAIGIASDAPIFVLLLLRRQIQAGMTVLKGIRSVLDRIGKVILFNGLSYWATFLPFLWSSLPPVRNFGGLVILNITICSLGTIVFLPALLKITRGIHSEVCYEKDIPVRGD